MLSPLVFGASRNRIGHPRLKGWKNKEFEGKGQALAGFLTSPLPRPPLAAHFTALFDTTDF